MFNLRVLIILSGIVGLSSLFGCDGPQGKIDRANQAAVDIPLICRQFGPDGSNPNTVDFQQCKKDSKPYQWDHEVRVLQTRTAMETTEEHEARRVDTQPTLAPTVCQVAISGDTISGIVIGLIGFWPWSGIYPSDTLISIEGDFMGYGQREMRVFTEAHGINAFPILQPGYEVCVAVR